MKITCVFLTTSIAGVSLAAPGQEWARPLSNSAFDQAIDNPSQHKVCQCAEPKILTSDGQCHNSLNTAVSSSTQHDTTIYIASDLTITEPLSIIYDTNFYGVDCSSQQSNSNVANINNKPIITSQVEGIEDIKGVAVDDKGLIMLEGGKFQNLRIRDLDFKFSPTKPEGFGHAILAPPNVISDAHWTSLDIRNSHFSHFVTRNWGTVISMQTAHNVNIDENTVFSYNQIKGYCDCYYGGMISAMYVSDVSTMTIGASFLNNIARYHYDYENERYGSEHAEGGAIYLYYVDGEVNLVGGRYVNNSANEGGAITVKTIGEGSVNIDGYFERNFVVDNGAQCRGGVVRVFDNMGDLSLKGTYINNTALGKYPGDSIPFSGRGAVFAGNYMTKYSSLYVEGVFKDNTSKDYGTVISLQGTKKSGNRVDGKITLSGSSTFEGNRCLDDPDTSVLWINKKKELDERDWYKRDGDTFTYN